MKLLMAVLMMGMPMLQCETFAGTIKVTKMFYNAILYCNSHNDILYLANNYIDSIENDNTLTIHDKRALYSSFVVAVYSYSLWGEYMDLASLENIS